ncbi:cyclase family protein [Catelliglobosispora koreensis]|uniref:cyclase family protein n=1 Tax=Catelliglobosispora koreensis TaxID=129052 RepID=UPI000370E9B3|nr:cyclase family protein [Catelliglobosispora koreensis]
MIEHRVQFDADVTFSNGGGLQVQEFRLDIPGEDISEADLAALFVRHLGLLMVGAVTFRNVEILAEAHKGSRGGPSETSSGNGKRLVELSHVIEEGMTTFPGLPGPVLSAHLSREASRERYAPGTEFEIGSITMVGNTGTYLDSPYHRWADGADLSALPLSSLADLPAIVVRAQSFSPLSFAPFDVAGKAVLLHTGWDKHWRTPSYAVDAPYLPGDAAQYLADHGAALVGIDSVNIDNMTPDGQRPAHSILLRAGIPILEHLTGLDQLPVTGARLHAAPPLVRHFTTFPVRAYAVIDA